MSTAPARTRSSASATGSTANGTRVNAVHGIKATPEAYKGFTLKNGWRIKSINVSHWRLGKTQFRWKEKPEIGSDNPYMQVLVSADPLGSYTKEGVSVLIEGPRGRDPYFD